MEAWFAIIKYSLAFKLQPIERMKLAYLRLKYGGMFNVPVEVYYHTMACIRLSDGDYEKLLPHIKSRGIAQGWRWMHTHYNHVACSLRER